MRGLLALITLTLTLAVAGPADAQADTPDLTVHVDTIVDEPPGTEVTLTTVDIPVDYQNTLCDASVDTANQESIHFGNDLRVTSLTSITIAEVEDGSGVIKTGSGPILVGTQMTIELLMGPDGVFSGGLDVDFDCGGDEHRCPPPLTITTQSIDPGDGPPPLGDGQVLLIKAGPNHYVGVNPTKLDVSHYDICGETVTTTTTTTVPDKPTTTTTTVVICRDENGNPHTYEGDPAHGPCGTVITTTTTTTTTPPTTPTTAPDCGPETLACTGSDQQTQWALGGLILLTLGGIVIVAGGKLSMK